MVHPVVAGIVLPLFRGVLGWARNAFADGKIDWPEWRLFGETVLRIGVPAVFAYYGLNGLGLDVDVITMVSIAVVLDILVPRIIEYFQKKKK